MRRRTTSALVTLTPIREGAQAALAATLEGLPSGSSSPFAALERTHFARWVVVPRLKGPDCAYLLFCCELDGSVTSYLAEMASAIPAHADAVWGHCAGDPGAARPGPFVRYLCGHRIEQGFSVAAYPGETAAEVQASLRLREQLRAFAVRAQRLEAAELKRAWQELSWW